MSPLVSILMPVHNRATTPARAIGSVKAQVFADYECIIYDDGSTDGSVAVALAETAGDPRFRVLKGVANLGVGGALRQAASMAHDPHCRYLAGPPPCSFPAASTMRWADSPACATARMGHCRLFAGCGDCLSRLRQNGGSETRGIG